MLTIIVTLALVMVTAVGAAEDATPAPPSLLSPAPAPPSLPSPAPLTAAWTKAPLCPLWGPMDSFYEEGIERGRVSLLGFSFKYYFNELIERKVMPVSKGSLSKISLCMFMFQ